MSRFRSFAAVRVAIASISSTFVFRSYPHRSMGGGYITMICLMFVVLLLLAVVWCQLHFTSRRRRLAARTWEEVLSRIEPINFEGLRSIADCYLQPDKDQLRVEPGSMWELLGGLEGICNLKSNAAVMLELALYAERWNAEQAPVISEIIRRDRVRLNKAVNRIVLAHFLHFGSLDTAFNLQEVASSYFLMRGRLIGLCHSSHSALLPRLEATL